MTIRMHRFKTESFEDRLDEYEREIQKCLSLESRQQGDPQAIGQQVLMFSVWNACILLVLESDEARALQYFRRAVEYGLKSLEAIGTTKQMRVYDVHVEHSEEGSRVTRWHETPPRDREPARLTYGDFLRVWMTTCAFGECGQIEAAARYPEERYRNPNVIVDEEAFTYLRAEKSLVLGDEATSRKELKAALATDRNPVTREHMKAFECLLDRDISGFRKHVEMRLLAHRKKYEREPWKPDGFICQPVLMQSRLAIDRGMEVEEWPYVPIHLLPNYGAVARAKLH